jgi:rhamnosyltransferase subunit B
MRHEVHAIFATLGTDGDVFPHIGLATELQRRGHRSTLAAPETYRDQALRAGLNFVPLVTSEEVGRMLADSDLWHPIRSGPMMARWGAPMIPRHYEILAPLAGQPDSILIANPGVLAARLVQEKLGCPTASLILQPGLLPSNTAPPVNPIGLEIARWLPNMLLDAYWLTIDFAGYLLVGRTLNAVRKQLGLKAVRRLFRWWLSPDLVIGLFPDWYARPQSDWPRQLQLVGFGKSDGERNELTDDIKAFCQSGSPPIVFTMGTGMMHAAEFFKESTNACQSIGARGLVLTKYNDLVPRTLPSNMKHCCFAPFRSLLPLCGAIVHHGGIGTTAAALEAGCPQLILPLAWDQPDNAARIKRLGVGGSLPMKRRSHSHLSQALATLMSSEVQTRCRQVATQFSMHDGFSQAADLIENLHQRREQAASS